MFQRRSLRPLLVALVVMAPVAAGCGNSDTASSTSTTAADATTTTFAFPTDEMVDETGKPVVEITAIDNSLEPRYVQVTAGTRIVWKNEGRNPHDILPDVEGAFPGATAAAMPSGATHTVTLDTPGDYPYYCSLHGTMRNGMNGAIRVVPKA